MANKKSIRTELQLRNLKAGLNPYDVPVVWTTLEVHYDLQSGRYLAMGLNNEEAFTADFTVDIKPADFTVSALRRSGRR